MRSKVVPIRLDRELLEFIDMLVKLGIFNSRSEAPRELIKASIEEFKWIPKVIEAVEKLFEIERKEKNIPIRLEGALKDLLRERERF